MNVMHTRSSLEAYKTGRGLNLRWCDVPSAVPTVVSAVPVEPALQRESPADHEAHVL